MQFTIHLLWRECFSFIKKTLIPTIILLNLTACAFGTREVNLSYPPEKNHEIGVANAANTTAKNGTFAVKVHTFKNNRPTVDPVTSQKKSSAIIGNVRNGFYMKTADVISNQNIEDWVTNAVKYELERNGYKVLDITPKESASSFWDFQGSTLNVYADAYFNYDGKVKLHLLLKQHSSNEVLIDKDYEGVYKEVNFAASEEGYKDILEKSLSNAIGLIIIDLNNLPREVGQNTFTSAN